MDDCKLASNSAGVARDGSYPSSSADVESKPNVLSAGDNDSNDMLSTTSGITTMSTIPGVQQKKMKPFKLADAIKPIEYDEMQRMSTDSFYRILNSEGCFCSLIKITQYRSVFPSI